jgi:hypothetical protein
LFCIFFAEQKWGSCKELSKSDPKESQRQVRRE